MQFPKNNNPISPNQLKDRPDIQHPSIYVDQLSAIAITAFTSRITLSIENHALMERQPVTTIIMPTASLHALAVEIINALNSPGQQALLAQNFNEYQNTLGKLTQPKEK